MTETIEHMFFFCNHAEYIWKAAPINWDGLNEFKHKFWHWWNGLMDVERRPEGKTHIALTVNILWQIWKDGNQIQFNGVSNCPGRTVSKAMHEWVEYNEVRDGEAKTDANREHRVTKLNSWHPPPLGVSKLNSDAAVEQNFRRIGWGVVARKEDGAVARVWARGAGREGNPTLEEALAIREAIIKAKHRGWNKVEIQSDCKLMVDKLNDRNAENPITGTILADNLLLSQGFEKCYFSFVRREGNCVSHKLAKFAISLKDEIYWLDSFPTWLTCLAKTDVRAVAQIV
ncbi:uncharacterized protein [Coffea arabica]|uniref:RNase H type-1 domain-containing protein n=1 Tax=Coffea arabica TaxID=13443 RepID=A0ABM4U1D6_COFAR